MKYHELQNLLIALGHQDLKGKHLSGDDFFSVLCLKKKGREHLTLIDEIQKELADQHKAVVIGNSYIIINSETKKKDEKAHAIFEESYKETLKDFTPEKLNFIPQADFKKWVDDISLEHAAILFEYLAVKD